MENKIDELKRKFGISTKGTIVDNLVKIPVKDKGLNVPITDVFKSNDTHQIDLLQLPEDKGYKYILLCVDLHSKKIGAYPLKNKLPKDILKGLEVIYKKSKYLKVPRQIEVDSGSEFKGEFEKHYSDLGVIIKIKKAGRHRSQSVVETYNGIVGKYLNKRMLANEIAINGEELIGDWVDDLQELIDVLNYMNDKSYTPNKMSKARDKMSDHGILPVGKGDALKMLPVGTNVRIILDEPRDIQDSKLHGTFRQGDIRWSKQPYKISMISIRPNEHPMYLVEGLKNVAYTKNQLQVIPKDELPPHKEAVQKFIIEKIVGKRTHQGKVEVLIKWKGYDDTHNTYEPIKNIPKQFITEYNKSLK